MKLVTPALEYLPSYTEALERGWSPDTIGLLETTRRELREIAEDTAKFVALMDDRDAQGSDIVLPDGSSVKRLPGFRRWMWDGAFCGSIGLRWQPGTSELPPHVLGHIGYSVVPWKQKRGYATQALADILKEAKEIGLKHVYITTDLKNAASQKVILANGGLCLGEYQKVAAYGGGVGLQYRISLGEF